MLIHICPRLSVPAGPNFPCTLVDIRIKEFNLLLVGGHDVVARQPFPNKRYHVACRRQGQQAVNGLLVYVDGHVPFFTVVTRWSIGSEVLLRHQVDYVVLDDEFEAVTDYVMLWADLTQLCAGMETWTSRVPDFFSKPLGLSSPVMMFDEQSLVGQRVPGQALQLEYCETFRMPTVEPGRLIPRDNDFHRRMPSVEHAFQVKAEAVNHG
ncbi:quorum threshold expression element, QteE [Pseudomonas protegens]|uniref:Quorum threshold expression element, QteE n=1 Tax=Pseudomonas protegens TaxID=380021 RepID=A0A2T6GBG3_9PSED|nr:DUF6012 family protein [Pseudomonas protegens]PUA41494.1 quorum threshold expression element, QteE [Pseudomonas protegens]